MAEDDTSYAASQRALIHQVNNLLGVIFTQAAVARSGEVPDPERALQAIDQIERAAEATSAVVQAARRAGDAGQA